MPKPNMSLFSKNLNARIGLVTLCYALSALAALGLCLFMQMDALAKKQQDTLGQAIANQLVESLKQPLIDRNAIHIQVILDNLLKETPAVMRATTYSGGNTILAQSQRSIPTTSLLRVYSKPINMNNNLLGRVSIELDSSAFLFEYRLPIGLTIGSWLVLTLLFLLWLNKKTTAYSLRIRVLNDSFPQHDINASVSELDLLEHTLEPFIQPALTQMIDVSYQYSLLAISIPNLPKWRAQLNANAFSQMLAKIDSIIDTHLSVFNGTRIHSRSTMLFLQFESIDNEHPIERALQCATALLKLCDDVAINEKLPFEMRIAVAYRQPAICGSPWRNDIEREECIERLIDMMPSASPWQLLIDQTHLNVTDIIGCDLEARPAANLWVFTEFHPQQQRQLDKQLAFLATNLQT